MERDLFLNLDYRDKLPIFYSLGLKPTVSLELYSVSRKADVDISFDEYDYTYNTKTNVTYNLFEVDFVLNHKIFAEGNNLELRFAYSDYVATLESFIIPTTTTLYPSTKDKYFVGRNIQIKYTHNSIFPTV
ncbi:MAG: biopolymer transporter Tol, partial [Candidatus Omnitrophica bacterium]|nr:biopolymer transporter Tol [Candidatus Omnitrophota bacterium]